MPTRALAEAVGDLRLSGEKIPGDVQAIKRELLRQVTILERDAVVDVGVQLDRSSVSTLQGQLRRVTDNIDATAHIGVDLDADDAAAQLAGLEDQLGRLQPVSVPVQVDTQQVDTSGIVPPLERAGLAAGERAGSQFGAAFQRALTPLSLAAGGFIATSLVRGFQRLTTIQDATTALTVQLGSATEAAKLLDDVLGVVRGTPFNLDQFSRAAANMVAFGVEAQKIPVYLTAIGEAAATRGGQANEFAQRLADIFGQIQAIGRISGEDLWSFAGVGVNALAILGNTLGRTTAEIRDLISEGAIPAEVALTALTNGILEGTDGINGATRAFEGTMAGLRQTLTGSIGGFEAATARFGVNIIRPFEGLLTDAFTSGADILDDFGARAERALGSLGSSPGMRAFRDFITTVPDEIGPFIDRLEGLESVLVPIGAGFGALGLGQLGAALGPLGALLPGVTSGLGAFGVALGALVAITPELRDQFGDAISGAFDTLSGAGSQFGQAFNDAVEAAIPLLSKLIDVGVGLIPVAESAIEVGTAFANVLTPGLSAFADVVEAIPTPVLTGLLAVIVGFKALDAVQRPLQNFASSLGALPDRLRNAVRPAEEAGRGWLTVGEGATRASRLVESSAVAIGGALAGVALQADDAATQVSGAIGAVGALAAGFATGGPVGGAIAGAGIALGTVAGLFLDASQHAAEIQANVDEASRALSENTVALLDNADALAAASTEAGAAATAYGLLGDAVRGAMDDADTTNIALNTIGLSSAGEEGARNLIRVLREIGAFGDEDGDVSRVPEIMRQLTAAFGDHAAEVAGVISQEENLESIFAQLDRVVGQLTPSQRALVDAIEQLQDASEDTDLSGVIRQTLQLNAANSDLFRTALERVEAQGKVNRFTEDETQLLRLYEQVLREVANSEGALADEQARRRLEQQGVTAAQIAELQNQADAAQIAFADFVVNLDTSDAEAGLDALTGDLDSLLDDGMEPVVEEADQLAREFEQADAALQDVTDELDRLLGRLSRTTALQDFAAGFRDIRSGLSEILNQSDIDAAQGLNEDIQEQRERIQELQEDVARETREAAADTAERRADLAFEADDLRRRIAEADAAGAVNGARALRNELARVLADAEDTQSGVADSVTRAQDQLDDAIDRLNELQGELQDLGNLTPVSLGNLLDTQALERGLSVFDLLVQAPTPESQDAFQQLIEPQIEQAFQIVQDTLENEGPAAAATAAQHYRDALKQGFIESGFSAETAEQIVATFFNVDDLIAEFATAEQELREKLIAQLIDRQGKGVDIGIDVEGINRQLAADIAGIGLDETGIPPINLVAELEKLSTDDLQELVDEADRKLLDMPATVEIEGDSSAFDDVMFDIVEGRYTAVVDVLPDTAVFDAALAARLTGGAVRGGLGGNPNLIPGILLRRGGILGSAPAGSMPSLAPHAPAFPLVSPRQPDIVTEGAYRAIYGDAGVVRESYIPWDLGTRTRATQVLVDTAAGFGYDVVPRGAAAGRSAPGEALSAAVMSRAERALSYDDSVHMENTFYVSDLGTARETARELRRRFVTTRSRPRRSSR